MYVHKPKDTDKYEHFIKHLVYILTVIERRATDERRTTNEVKGSTFPATRMPRPDDPSPRPPQHAKTAQKQAKLPSDEALRPRVILNKNRGDPKQWNRVK
ncbi:hypothetical protein GW17_00056666 [Ensete ventricosum]|nr:hypothetical protein GW17_00056666 [Ensete ventricosum]